MLDLQSLQRTFNAYERAQVEASARTEAFLKDMLGVRLETSLWGVAVMLMLSRVKASSTGMPESVLVPYVDGSLMRFDYRSDRWRVSVGDRAITIRDVLAFDPCVAPDRSLASDVRDGVLTALGLAGNTFAVAEIGRMIGVSAPVDFTTVATLLNYLPDHAAAAAAYHGARLSVLLSIIDRQSFSHDLVRWSADANVTFDTFDFPDIVRLKRQWASLPGQETFVVNLPSILVKTIGDGDFVAAAAAVRAGADVNREDNGRFPLLEAIRLAPAKLVEVMIAAGADINVRDGDGRVASEHLLLRGSRRFDIVEDAPPVPYAQADEAKEMTSLLIRTPGFGQSIRFIPMKKLELAAYRMGRTTSCLFHADLFDVLKLAYEDAQAPFKETVRDLRALETGWHGPRSPAPTEASIARIKEVSALVPILTAPDDVEVDPDDATVILRWTNKQSKPSLYLSFSADGNIVGSGFLAGGAAHRAWKMRDGDVSNFVAQLKSSSLIQALDQA